ncbi:MAG TPA: hypothetical protein VMU30_01340 [Bacteroidota bacterium]|nr:hypothetical protein [Bacteroidota bacterium]
MKKQSTQDIERFFGYFRRLLLGVSSTKYVFSPAACESILLCSMLDTLSKCVYDYLASNRSRFVCFVDDFSGWKCRDRISMVQLFYFLQKQDHLKYAKTKEFVGRRIAGLISGTIYKASEDLLLSDIIYPKVIEEEIRQFSYSNLLYKFRNSLVHDFKTPGAGIDFGDLDEAFYHHMSHYDYVDETPVLVDSSWELVFPAKYLESLVSQSIENLYSYCVSNKLNPYEHYYFDSPWISSQEVKRHAKS